MKLGFKEVKRLLPQPPLSSSTVGKVANVHKTSLPIGQDVYMVPKYYPPSRFLTSVSEMQFSIGDLQPPLYIGGEISTNNNKAS